MSLFYKFAFVFTILRLYFVYPDHIKRVLNGIASALHAFAQEYNNAYVDDDEEI